MRFRQSWQRWSAMLLSPVAGATVSATAFYLAARLSLHLSPGSGATYLQYAFAIPFARELVVGYLLPFPTLFLARWLGLRASAAFMVVSGLSVSPVAYFLFTPRLSMLFGTEEELLHGTHWESVLLYMVFATATGWLFSCGVPLGLPAQNHFSPTRDTCADDA